MRQPAAPSGLSSSNPHQTCVTLGLIRRGAFFGHCDARQAGAKTPFLHPAICALPCRMKHYFPADRHLRARSLAVPPFHAVPLRLRADGWTPLRQAEFIGHLAATRSVAEAAREVSMAREALKPSRKVTTEQLSWRVETGIWQVRLRAGRYASVCRKADKSALFALLARTARGAVGEAV